MAFNVGGIFGTINLDIRSFRERLRDAGNDARSESNKIQNSFDSVGMNKATNSVISFKAALAAVAASGAVIAITNQLKQSVLAASDLEETASKFSVVFKGQESKAERWSKALVEGYAMSTREAKLYLSSIQDLLVPMGVQADLAGDLSFKMTRLAADLGSFNNLKTADVMGDIQSAMVGEFEPMKKYGVVLNAATVQQKALNMGLAETKKKLTAAHTAQAAYALIVQSSQAAIGDMDRTAGSFANQLKKLEANIEDSKAAIGKELLPVVTDIISEINTWYASNQKFIDQGFSRSVSAIKGAIDELSEAYKTLPKEVRGIISYNVVDFYNDLYDFFSKFDSLNPDSKGKEEPSSKLIFPIKEQFQEWKKLKDMVDEVDKTMLKFPNSVDQVAVSIDITKLVEEKNKKMLAFHRDAYSKMGEMTDAHYQYELYAIDNYVAAYKNATGDIVTAEKIKNALLDNLTLKRNKKIIGWAEDLISETSSNGPSTLGDISYSVAFPTNGDDEKRETRLLQEKALFDKVQDFSSNALYNIMDDWENGFENLGESILDIFKRTFAEVAVQKLIMPQLEGIVNSAIGSDGVSSGIANVFGGGMTGGVAAGAALAGVGFIGSKILGSMADADKQAEEYRLFTGQLMAMQSLTKVLQQNTIALEKKNAPGYVDHPWVSDIESLKSGLDTALENFNKNQLPGDWSKGLWNIEQTEGQTEFFTDEWGVKYPKQAPTDNIDAILDRFTTAVDQLEVARVVSENGQESLWPSNIKEFEKYQEGTQVIDWLREAKDNFDSKINLVVGSINESIVEYSQEILNPKSELEVKQQEVKTAYQQHFAAINDLLVEVMPDDLAEVLPADWGFSKDLFEKYLNTSDKTVDPDTLLKAIGVTDGFLADLETIGITSTDIVMRLQEGTAALYQAQGEVLTGLNTDTVQSLLWESIENSDSAKQFSAKVHDAAIEGLYQAFTNKFSDVVTSAIIDPFNQQVGELLETMDFSSNNFALNVVSAGATLKTALDESVKKLNVMVEVMNSDEFKRAWEDWQRNIQQFQSTSLALVKAQAQIVYKTQEEIYGNNELSQSFQDRLKEALGIGDNQWWLDMSAKYNVAIETMTYEWVKSVVTAFSELKDISGISDDVQSDILELANRLIDFKEAARAAAEELEKSFEEVNYYIKNPKATETQYIMDNLTQIMSSSALNIETLQSFGQLLISWYQSAVTEAETQAGYWSQAGESVTDLLNAIASTRQGIKFGELNVSTPLEKFNLAKEEYYKLGSKAAAGDQDAAQDFLSFVPEYLQMAQDVYKSSDAYKAIYESVLQDLENAEKYVQSTDYQKSIYEQLIENQSETHADLTDINSTFSSMQGWLDGNFEKITGTQLKLDWQGIDQTALADGITDVAQEVTDAQTDIGILSGQMEGFRETLMGGSIFGSQAAYDHINKWAPGTLMEGETPSLLHYLTALNEGMRVTLIEAIKESKGEQPVNVTVQIGNQEFDAYIVQKAEDLRVNAEKRNMGTRRIYS